MRPTTVGQIAAAAEVTRRDFMRRFATKDAVLLSIVEDMLAQLRSQAVHPGTPLCGDA
jgi:AcrR family transcriptional regulator